LALGRDGLRLARAHRHAIEVDRAGAAQAGAAAVLRAGQSDVVADDPQERRRRVGFDRHALAVQRERDHVTSPGRCPFWLCQSARARISRTTAETGRALAMPDSLAKRILS